MQISCAKVGQTVPKWDSGMASDAASDVASDCVTCCVCHLSIIRASSKGSHPVYSLSRLCAHAWMWGAPEPTRCMSCTIAPHWLQHCFDLRVISCLRTLGELKTWHAIRIKTMCQYRLHSHNVKVWDCNIFEDWCLTLTLLNLPLQLELWDFNFLKLSRVLTTEAVQCGTTQAYTIEVSIITHYLTQYIYSDIK